MSREKEFFDEQKLLVAALLVDQVKSKQTIAHLSEVEFKVFSQWGDDGIVQWLVHNLPSIPETFVEFGVEDYRESNTRFLMMQNNWRGLVMDSATNNIAKIRQADFFWKYDLTAVEAFITTANINGVISESGFGGELGLLHVDVDGNDYWIWEAITCVRPCIVIIEYNSVFGKDRAISVPYQENFNRTEAHYSNLYFGASLPALASLGEKKGFAFIGCNSAGNNAYFVRRELLNDVVRDVSVEKGYVCSKFRESRDRNYQLTFLAGADRLREIKGLPVINVHTGQQETL